MREVAGGYAYDDNEINQTNEITLRSGGNSVNQHLERELNERLQMALNKLSKENIVDLDDDKKAAMVSNLLVVLCADEAAQPVVNTGTLHQ